MSDALAATSAPALRVMRMLLHTHHQAVVLMHVDCHVCQSEGLRA